MSILHLELLIHILNQIFAIIIILQFYYSEIYYYHAFILATCFISYRFVAATVFVKENNVSILQRIIQFPLCLLFEYQYIHILKTQGQIQFMKSMSISSLTSRLIFIESTVLCIVQSVLCLLYLLQSDVIHVMIWLSFISSSTMMFINACHSFMSLHLIVQQYSGALCQIFIFAVLGYCYNYMVYYHYLVWLFFILGKCMIAIAASVENNYNILFGLISIHHVPYEYFLNKKQFIWSMGVDLVINCICMGFITYFTSIQVQNGQINQTAFVIFFGSIYVLLLCNFIHYIMFYMKIPQVSSHKTASNKTQELSGVIINELEMDNFGASNCKIPWLRSIALQDIEIDRQINQCMKQSTKHQEILVTGYNDHTFNACHVFDVLKDWQIVGDTDTSHCDFKVDISQNDKVLLVNGYINRYVETSNKCIYNDIIQQIAMFYFPGLLCCNALDSSPIKETVVVMNEKLKKFIHFIHVNHNMLNQRILPIFDQCEMIIYCISLTIALDVNKLRDALDDFKSIVNCEEMKKKKIILLLLQKTRFIELISETPLNALYPHFNTDGINENCKQEIKFIEYLFRRSVDYGRIYCTATDIASAELLRGITGAITHNSINNMVRNNGMLM